MRKFLPIAAALALLVTIAVIILVVFKPFRPHTQSSILALTTSATSKVIHTPLPSSDVTFLQDHMNSADTTAQSRAWLPELRAAYVTSLTNPLPAGKKLVIDAKTFWYAKDYGEAQATAGTVTYMLHLERSGSQWLLVWADKN